MRILTFILTVFILSSATDLVIACSCKKGETVKEEIKDADAILVGKIISRDLVQLFDTVFTGELNKDTFVLKRTIARFGLVVQHIYKGEVSLDTITIYTGISSGDCGFRFTIGDKYIIYGKHASYFGGFQTYTKYPEGKNQYWTSICYRTMPFSEVEIIEIEKYAKRR